MDDHVSELPSALDSVEEIAGRLQRGRPAVFLDFDGTLAPITDDPSDTFIPPETRAAVEHLRSVCPVAVVSGRDLEDVRHLVGVEGIHYAGSHGFDVLEADGTRHRMASDFKPDLGRAAKALDRALDDFDGAFLERKAFALAIHYRMLEEPGQEPAIEEAVDRVVADEPRLRKTGGKKIFEIRPDVEWHKGKAVAMLAGFLSDDERGPEDSREDRPEGSSEEGVPPLESGDVIPLYVGDDLTDEDAFEAIADHGVGVVVRGEEDDRETAASYVLDEPGRVREFLERLAHCLGREREGG